MSSTTSRRDFLKAGAMAAVPVAAAAIPATATAADGSREALARLQDERALEALTRDALRQFNRGGGTLFADGVTRVALADEPHELTVSGDAATARFACTVEMAHELTGQGTLIDMARLQGNTAHLATSGKTLVASYSRQQGQWAITALDLA